MGHSFDHMSDYIAAHARNSDPPGTLVRNALKDGRTALREMHGAALEIHEFTIAGTLLSSPRDVLLRGEPIMLRAYKPASSDSDEMVVAGEMIIRIRPSLLAKLR